MSAYVFDGKQFAGEIEKNLSDRVIKLTRRFRRRPKLVSILVGDNPASKLYVGLKKMAAERIGVDFELAEFAGGELEAMNRFIGVKNADPTVDGIMIQLPIPGLQGSALQGVLGRINPNKDVDGLGSDSTFLPATVRAVIAILDESLQVTNLKSQVSRLKVIVIGNKGAVGRPLEIHLKSGGFQVVGVDLETKDLSVVTSKVDVVISATGQPGLIKPEMVKEGVIAIDVGSPEGDFDPEVAIKASFFTPVPGGVGPVTVAMLFENLVDSVG